MTSLVILCKIFLHKSGEIHNSQMRMCSESFVDLAEKSRSLGHLRHRWRKDLHNFLNWNVSNFQWQTLHYYQYATTNAGKKVNSINLEFNQFCYKYYSHGEVISLVRQRHLLFSFDTSIYLHTGTYPSCRKAWNVWAL